MDKASHSDPPTVHSSTQLDSDRELPLVERPVDPARHFRCAHRAHGKFQITQSVWTTSSSSFSKRGRSSPRQRCSRTETEGGRGALRWNVARRFTPMAPSVGGVLCVGAGGGEGREVRCWVVGDTHSTPVRVENGSWNGAPSLRAHMTRDGASCRPSWSFSGRGGEESV